LIGLNVRIVGIVNFIGDNYCN